MAVTCPVCGQTSAGVGVCDYCRSPLPAQTGIVPPSALPPVQPVPTEEEELPMVLPVVRKREPEPWDEPPRPVVRKVEGPPPERKSPWLWVGVIGGALALVIVVIAGVFVAALGLRGDKSGSPKDTRAIESTPDPERALRARVRAAGVSDDTIDKMLELLAPKVDKTLVDLGCCDGRLALKAADKFGTFVLAWDNDAAFVKLADRLVDDHQRKNLVAVQQTDDVLAVDLSKADYVVLARPERFGDPDTVARKLLKQLREAKPGARVVTTHRLVPDFRAAKVVPFPPADDPGRQWTLYLYVTPLE
jgi:hypothetical protein